MNIININASYYKSTWYKCYSVVSSTNKCYGKFFISNDESKRFTV